MKAPFFVAEDLRLEQRVGQRGAVDRLEAVRAAAAQLVDHPRHELLARSGRPEDQDRDVGLRRGADPLEDDEHLLVLADHLAEALDRRGAILAADGGAPLEELVEEVVHDVPFRLDEPVLRRRRGRRVFFAMPNACSSRTQFSTSSRMRPNVCISASTSKVSSGRAHMKRRMPARSGDCTRFWNSRGDLRGVRAAPGRRRCRGLDMSSARFVP